jgi:hypothetical protein
MAGFYPLDFRSPRSAAGTSRAPMRRTTAQREMVNGLVAHALYKAIKEKAAERKLAVYKLVDEMNIGSSTYQRMYNAQPIAQSTALKVVTFLGTSVRAVVSKQHQEKK